MQSNSKIHTSTSLTSIVFYIVVGLLLNACSGGISGTGDGGQPGDVINVDQNVSDGDGSAPQTGGDAGSGDSDDDSIPQTPDTSRIIPAALQQLNMQNDSASAALPLIAQLSSLQQEVNTALEMTGTAAGTLTTNVSDAFDATFRFTFNNTETLIARSSFSTVSYIFSTNSERTLYVLQEDNRVTARHLDRTSNSLLQARIILMADGSTIIEADLNQNGIQSYFQTYSDASTTAVFSEHPTDPTIARQRELIDTNGALTILQNCTAATQDCDLDSSWSNENATSNVQFSNARNSIEADLDTVTSPPITLPDSVDEAVATQQTNNDQPTEEQIQCGVQRVTDTVRVFCWLPQPLAPTSLFSETLAGDEIFYQPLE